MKRPAVTVSVADVVPITWQPGYRRLRHGRRLSGDRRRRRVGRRRQGDHVQGERTRGRWASPGPDRRRRRARRSLGRSVEPYHRQGGPGSGAVAVEAGRRHERHRRSRAGRLQQGSIRSRQAASHARPEGDQGALHRRRSAFRASISASMCRPATVVVTLQDLDRMKVDFTVPEQALRIAQDRPAGPFRRPTTR